MTFATVAAPALLFGATLIFAAAPVMAALTNAPTAQSSPVTAATFAKGLVHPWGLGVPPRRAPARDRAAGPHARHRQGWPVSGRRWRACRRSTPRGRAVFLDVRLAPDFAKSGTIFFSYAEAAQGGKNGTSVARARLVLEGEGGRLEDVEVIFRQEPSYASDNHFGSRLVFDRDGMLFVTLGERFELMKEAQNPANHIGKIVRITPDGRRRPATPTARTGTRRSGRSGTATSRAPTCTPDTGQLWEVEHGPRGGDELNIARSRPQLRLAGDRLRPPLLGSQDRRGHGQGGHGAADLLLGPLDRRLRARLLHGRLFPEWKGNLFTGALAGEHLERLVLEGDKVVAHEKLLSDLGERIRDVRQGPDGALWLLTDSPNGRVLRVTPRK